MKLLSLSLPEYELESWPEASVSTGNVEQISLHLRVSRSRMHTAKDTAGEASEFALYIESTWYKERKRGCPRA